jgi:hypothetical protein
MRVMQQHTSRRRFSTRRSARTNLPPSSTWAKACTGSKSGAAQALRETRLLRGMLLLPPSRRTARTVRSCLPTPPRQVHTLICMYVCMYVCSGIGRERESVVRSGIGRERDSAVRTGIGRESERELFPSPSIALPMPLALHLSQLTRPASPDTARASHPT